MNTKSLNLKSALEAISVAAVVLSLIFVGLEMNESTGATRSAIAAETTATIAEWYTSLGSDQQVSSVLRSFYLEEEGTLSAEIRRSMTQAILAEPGVWFYWEQRKAIFVNEDFIAFIEQTLSGENTHSKDLYRPPDGQ